MFSRVSIEVARSLRGGRRVHWRPAELSPTIGRNERRPVRVRPNGDGRRSAVSWWVTTVLSGRGSPWALRVEDAGVDCRGQRHDAADAAGGGGVAGIRLPGGCRWRGGLGALPSDRRGRDYQRLG